MIRADQKRIFTGEIFLALYFQTEENDREKIGQLGDQIKSEFNQRFRSQDLLDLFLVFGLERLFEDLAP